MLHTNRASKSSRGLKNENSSVRRSQAAGLLRRIPKGSDKELILDYLEAIGTPVALSVWLMYSSGEHAQLVTHEINKNAYLDRNPFHRMDYLPSVDRFRSDYAASRFLSKCAGLNTGIDLKEVAISSARRAESICESTNKRLRMEVSSQAVMPEIVSRNFFKITRKIANILGPLPTSFDDCGWTPGRTSSSSGDRLSAVHKYCSRPDVTLSARHEARKLLADSPIWGSSVLNADGPCSLLTKEFTTVKGNTLITVPKNAKTDRVICFEPHMNVRLQRSVGTYIQEKLRKHGVNLLDQSVNQRRAKFASKTGKLATIDLSMASDTLSYELVYQLLPIDWALYLDKLACRYTLWPDGEWRRNAKFSSMGNGFTFELESLIFYALAGAVSENVSVYGDDIIVATEAFEDVKCVLNWAGFILNEGKSYHSGLFRESCGADYFAGCDVSPVYLRSIPNRIEDAVKLHNRVREWCGRGIAEIRFARILRKWRCIHTCYRGPSGYGDGHYHVNFDESSSQRASFGLDGWWFKSYIRSYRVNSMYGDRVEGRFSSGAAWGALCASLGPKRSLDVVQGSVDRRQYSLKSARLLASFTWPDIVWY